MSATGGAPDGNINLKFTADTEGIKGGSLEMQKAVESLLKTVKETDRAMRSSLSGYADAMKQNAGASQNFYTQLKGLEETAQKLRASLANTKEASMSFIVLQNDIKRVQYAINNLEREKERLNNKTPWFEMEETERIEAQIEELQEKLKGLRLTPGSINTSEYEENRKEAAELTKQISYLQKQLNAFKNADTELSINKEVLTKQIEEAKAELATFEKQRDEMLKNGTAYTQPPDTDAQSQQLAVVEGQIAAMKSAASTSKEYQQQMAEGMQAAIEAENQTITELQEKIRAVDAEQQQLGISAFGNVEAYNAWVEKFDEIGLRLDEYPAKMRELEEQLNQQMQQVSADDKAYVRGEVGLKQVQEAIEYADKLNEKLENMKAVSEEAFANFGAEGVEQWNGLESKATQYGVSIEESKTKIDEMNTSLNDLDGTSERVSAQQMSLSLGIKLFGIGAVQAFGLVAKGIYSVLNGFSKIYTVTFEIASAVAQMALKVASGIAKITWNAIQAAASLAKIAAGRILSFLGNLATNAINAAKNLAKITANAVVNGLRKIADGAAQAAAQLAKLAGDAIKSGISKLTSMIGNASKSLLHLGNSAKHSSGGFNLSFKSLMRYGLGVRSTFALVNKLRRAVTDAVNALVKESPRLNAAMSSMATSLNMVKNSLATAFEPIITAVAPYITALLDMVASALTTIGEFFAVLTGQNTIFQAKRVQVDYAKSLDKTKDSTNKANKSTGKTAKNLKKVGQEAKEAENQLAGFDHLNILSANKSSSPDSNLSGLGDAAAKAGKNAKATQKLFDEKGISGAFAKWFSKIKSLFKQGKFKEIGKLIANAINKAFKKVNSLVDWSRIGNTLTKYINALTEIFNSLVDNIDWRLIGDTFAKLADAVIKSAYMLLTGVDWENLGKRIGEGIDAFVNSIDWNTLGAVMGMRATLMLRTLTSALLSIDWVKLGDNIGIGINSFIDVINDTLENIDFKEIVFRITNGLNNAITTISWYDIGALLGNIISMALDMMLTFVQNFKWGEAGLQFVNAIEGLADQINSDTVGDLLVSAMNGAIEMLTSFVGGFTWDTPGEDGESVGSKFGNTVNRLVDEVDWTQLGETFGTMIDGAIKNLLDAVSAFDWGSAGTVFAGTVNGLMGKIHPTQLGELMAAGINGALNFILNAVRDFDWGEAGLKFGQTINALRTKFSTKTLGDILQTGIEGALNFLLNAVSGFTWGEAGTTFGEEVEKLSTQEKLVKLGEMLRIRIGAALYKLRKKIEDFDLDEAGKTFANTINAFFENEEMWKSAGKILTKMVGEFLDFSANFFATFNATQLGTDIRVFLTEGIEWDTIASKMWAVVRIAFSKAGDFLSALFNIDKKSVDYKSIEDASERMEAVRNRAFDTNKSIDASGFGTRIGEMLNSAIAKIPSKKIGKTFDTAIKTAIDFATALVNSFDADTFSTKFAELLQNIDWAGIAHAFFTLLGNGIYKVAETGVKSIIKLLPISDKVKEELINSINVSDIVSDQFNTLNNAIKNSQSESRDVFQGAMDSIFNSKYVQTAIHQGIPVADAYFMGFKQTVLDKSKKVKPEFADALNGIFTDENIEALENGTLTAQDFFAALIASGIDSKGEVTDSFGNLLTAIMTDASGGMQEAGSDAGTDTVASIYESFIDELSYDNGRIRDEYSKAFENIYGSLDSFSEGSDSAYQFMDGFIDMVVDENGHVKDEYQNSIFEIFGSVDSFEAGEFTMEQFYGALIEYLHDSSPECINAFNTTFTRIFGSVDTDTELNIDTTVDGSADGSATTSKINTAVDNVDAVIDIGATYDDYETPVDMARGITTAVTGEDYEANVDVTYNGNSSAQEPANALANGFKGQDGVFARPKVIVGYADSKGAMEISEIPNRFRTGISQRDMPKVDVPLTYDGNDTPTGAYNAMSNSFGDTVNTPIALQRSGWTTINDFIGVAKDTALDIKVRLVNAVSNVADTIAGWFGGGKKETKSTDISNPYTEGSRVAQEALNSLKTAVTNMKTDVSAKFAALRTAITSHVQLIKTNITTGFTTIKTTVTTLMDGMKSSVSTTFTVLKSTITNSATMTKTTVVTNFTTMKTTAISLMNGMRTSIVTTFSLLKSDITNSVQTTKSNVVSNFTTIKNTIVNMLNNAKTSVSNMNWYDVGANIVRGINSGINGWWGWLNSSVWNLAYGLYNTARNALGIRSPSKLFRDEVGYMVGLGLAEGIDDSEGSVLDSVSSLASQMVNEMNGTEMTADLDTSGDHMLDGLDGVLSVFSDKVENSFSTLVARLNTIASTVAFRTPAVAAGTVMPYSVAGTSMDGSTGLSDALEASTNDLASVIIQATNQAALAIVRAIQQSGGNTTEEDIRARTDKVIAEINRRTRAQGSSPLLI